jgi:hypothetical protein
MPACTVLEFSWPVSSNNADALIWAVVPINFIAIAAALMAWGLRAA